MFPGQTVFASLSDEIHQHSLWIAAFIQAISFALIIFHFTPVSENDFIHSVHIGPPQIMQQEESSHCHFHVCCEKEQHYTLFSHHHFNYPPSGTHTLQEQGSSLSIKNREIIYFSMTSGRARSSSLSPSPSFPLLWCLFTVYARWCYMSPGSQLKASPWLGCTI